MSSEKNPEQPEWNTVKRRVPRSDRRAPTASQSEAPTQANPVYQEHRQRLIQHRDRIIHYLENNEVATVGDVKVGEEQRAVTHQSLGVVDTARPLARPLARPRPRENSRSSDAPTQFNRPRRSEASDRPSVDPSSAPHERLPEAFVQKLQKAHQLAFRELCLSQRTVDDYVADRMHLIDERTGRPSTNVRLSFSSLRDLTDPEFMKTYVAQKEHENKERESKGRQHRGRDGERERLYPGYTPKMDEFEIEGEQFNRSRIYGKPRFREEVQAYYAKMGYEARYSFYENKEGKRVYNMYISW